MKLRGLVVVVSLVLSLAGFGVSQTLGFKHVIIIVQENRTPDNLFGKAGVQGADVMVNTQFGKGVDIGGPQGAIHTHAQFLLQASGGKIHRDAYNYVVSGADPYWAMAKQYGFANRMFQTNQGPSFPSHQFLISGTSAPDDVSDLFMSENLTQGSPGCRNNPANLVAALAPDGTISMVSTCFDRASLMDLLDEAGLTWRYYAAAGKTFWSAPVSLKKYYKSKNLVMNPPQILTDIAGNTLANVSWVTPGLLYSDHPGGSTGGPAWVASIVNAVGASPYWQDTAIIVTWDDWGGEWDHVPPLPNNTGWCQIYCYGYRVPLLVISTLTPPGYVDNDIHDYGSILRFVESNFSLSTIGDGGWADSFADDLSAFFTTKARQFVPIQSRRLTKRESMDTTEPDDD